MIMKKIALAVLGLSCVAGSFACSTIIVGKQVSADGSIIVARNEDGSKGNHPVHYVRHPAMEKGYLFQSAQTAKFTYQMPDHLLAYTGMPDFDGKNKSYEEIGTNSAGVTMSATETIYSSDKALKADPYVADTGITESEVTSILLPQMHSAREGVQILGHIIDTIGSAEGFGIAFVDHNEAWYLENGGGHQWVAIRIPDNQYFVSANQGRIHQVDLNDGANVMHSANLVDVAVKNGLATAPTDGKFNFFAAYTQDVANDVTYNYRRVWTMQQLFTPSFKSDSYKDGNAPMFLAPDHKLSVADVESALQNHYQGQGAEFDPYSTNNPKTQYRPISVFRAQESHVVSIRANVPAPIAAVQNTLLGMTALGIYVPLYQGATIPKAYQLGTDQADNDSAWWKFRKLQTLVMQNFPKYSPQVKDAYAKLADDIRAQQAKFEPEYIKVYAKNPKRAQKMLDDFTNHTVEQVFALTDQLTNSVMSQLSSDVSEQWLFEGA
jgi:dipeptidase